jgi:hypothetical protein
MRESGVFDLDGYLNRHFSELKRSGDERILTCFWCGKRGKLYVNVKKGRFFCFRCGAGTHASLADFIKDHRGTTRSEAWAFIKGHSLDIARPRYDSGEAPGERLQRLFQTRRPDAIEDGLPPEYKPLYPLGELSDTVFAERAMAYLHGRGLSDGDCLLYRIGVCLDGRYRFRIIIPIVESGISVYFVARLFFGIGKRYLNPPHESLSVDPSALLFNWDMAKQAAHLRLAEGVFDSMSLGESAAALLGNVLKSGQRRRLEIGAWASAEIWLDADARAEADVLAQELQQLKPDAQITVRGLASGDPSSTADRESVPEHPVGSLRDYVLARWQRRGGTR